MTGQTDLQIAFTPPLADRIDRYFVELGLGVNAWRLAHERRDILLWLNAQTDADLAGMGTDARRYSGACLPRPLFLSTILVQRLSRGMVPSGGRLHVARPAGLIALIRTEDAR